MYLFRFSPLFGLIFPIFLIGSTVVQSEVAFPGAVGYGQFANGWKGGLYIPVTSLDGSGPGTLRACAELGPMPKVCGFQISGTIRVDQPIFVAPNTYIAGQTAPGAGVELRLGTGHLTPLVIKNAHDVVVRHLKIRPGLGDRESANIDAVTIENSERVYLDHLSLMFASDETVNVHVSDSRVADITIANSILAYGLDEAGHPKGRHSKGALICSDEGTRKECGRITLWHNLFAHNRDRNPDIKGTDVGPIEIVNNVFYNPISQFGEFYDTLGNAEIAYIGNHALAGPSTIEDLPEAVQLFEWTEGIHVTLVANDNRAIDRGRCNRNKPFDVLDPTAQAATMLAAPTVKIVAPIIPADTAYQNVLNSAGDTLPGARARDTLDARVVSDVLNCNGKVIDSPADLGLWPALPIAEGPKDSDGDGLPDSWENEQGYDIDAVTQLWHPSGFENLSVVELWLASLAGDVP